MADAVTRKLQTRIALKYDSYANWTKAPGKDLVLLKGEMGICHIDSATQGSNYIPTVLFKIGDGNKTFENLPWASAKAADVYAWAKASDIYVDSNNQLVLAGGGVDAQGNRKDITLKFNFLTESDVSQLRTDVGTLKSQVATINTSLGANGTIGKAVADNTANISINTTAIANEATARQTADNTLRTDVWDALGADYKKGNGNTVKDAITAVDTKVTNLTTGQVATNAANIGDLNTRLANEVTARQQGDLGLDTRLQKVEAFFATAEGETLDTALDTLVEIQDYLDGDGSTTGDVFGKIAANTTAIGEIQVFVNKDDNGTLQNTVKGHTTTLASHTTALEKLNKAAKTYIAKTGTALEDAILKDVNEAKQAAQNAANAASTADGKAVAAQTAANTADGKAVAAQNTANSAVTRLNGVDSKIAAIETNYVAEVDQLIIDCGTATECVFPKPATT